MRISTFILVFLILVSPCQARIIYVDANTPDNNDGSSWTLAYKYLQDGLAAASYGDEVRVAQGSYIPDQNSANPGGSGSRDATFQLINGVTLKGGYAGDGEPDPNVRDIVNNVTTLSGDLSGDDGIDFSNNTENSYHVVTGVVIGESAVLDGFKITAGNANESQASSSNAYGGGLYNVTGEVILTNCTFSGNLARRRGGGICNDDGYMTVTNCTFSKNSVRTDGFAWNGGGGIYSDDGHMVISNCIFSENSAKNYTGNWSGGGGVYSNDGYMEIANCTFSKNTADLFGGGVHNINANLTVTDCTFMWNTSGYEGGGLCNDLENLTLTNCKFIANSAGHLGGGLTCSHYGALVTNCVFVGNHSDKFGGGLGTAYLYLNDLTVSNCTFTGNSAVDYGGAVYDGFYEPEAESNLTLTNCVFWGNSAGSEGPEIAMENGGTMSINYCCLQGGQWDVYIPEATLVWGDANNIDVDPLFVDADGADDTVGTEDDNTRLTNGSPCIDAGDNTAVPAGINDDLNGFARFIDDLCTVDTGNGTAPVVDMGTYEFLRSDIDSDGDVNFKDFSQFALYWLDVACGTCSGTDLTCDGDVDIDDLKEFVDNWLSKQ